MYELKATAGFDAALDRGEYRSRHSHPEAHGKV